MIIPPLGIFSLPPLLLLPSDAEQLGVSFVRLLFLSSFPAVRKLAQPIPLCLLLGFGIFLSIPLLSWAAALSMLLHVRSLVGVVITHHRSRLIEIGAARVHRRAVEFWLLLLLRVLANEPMLKEGVTPFDDAAIALHKGVPVFCQSGLGPELTKQTLNAVCLVILLCELIRNNYPEPLVLVPGIVVVEGLLFELVAQLLDSHFVVVRIFLKGLQFDCCLLIISIGSLAMLLLLLGD